MKIQSHYTAQVLYRIKQYSNLILQWRLADQSPSKVTVQGTSANSDCSSESICLWTVQNFSEFSCHFLTKSTVYVPCFRAMSTMAIVAVVPYDSSNEQAKKSLDQSEKIGDQYDNALQSLDSSPMVYKKSPAFKHLLSLWKIKTSFRGIS